MADIFGASICKATHVLHDSSIINTILIHKGNNVHLGPARLIIKCSHCILIIYYYKMGGWFWCNCNYYKIKRTLGIRYLDVEEKLNQIIPLHLKGGIDNKEPCLCIHVAMKQFKDIQRHSLQLCNGMYKITSKIFTKLTWAPWLVLHSSTKVYGYGICSWT